jgi:hypothetical protein
LVAAASTASERLSYEDRSTPAKIVRVVALHWCLAFALAPPLAAGDLVVDEIASKAIARTVKLNVLLPDGYAEASERRYPVVYLLHGVGGDYTEWARVGVVEEAKGLAAIISRQLEALELATKSKAVTAEGLVGEWDLVVKYSEDFAFDSTLKIEKRGEELKAVQGSPRSGEHPFKCAAIVDGKLRLVIEREIQGNDVTLEFEGGPGKEGLQGTAVVKGIEGQLSFTWTATRRKKGPEGE